MTPHIDVQTVILVGGGLYIVLPLAAWSILSTRHDATSVALWCGGGLLYGIGFTLIGLRGALPAWAFLVANAIAVGSYPMRALGLRRELGQPGRSYIGGVLLAAVLFVYAILFEAGVIESRYLLVAVLAHAAGSLWLAALAWRLARVLPSRSAALLCGAFGLVALSLAVRACFVMANWNDARTMSGSIDFFVTFAAGIVAALYGTLGYIGIALERSRARELAHGAELAREAEARAQTERRAQEQAELLAERSRLLAQHEEMLAVLAHEVRQPLNNASAALQSASETMSQEQVDRQAAASRLERANAVLLQVTAALDNTLTDAVLLRDGNSPARHDIDIDTLVNLAIADIDARDRGRIRRERSTDTRTASMNAGLMRLALRNLIANALAYSPADSEVAVRVADSDEPLALVIDVVDRGKGIPPELLPKLFDRGVRGEADPHRFGHGLGLYIVRRVMDAHRGDVVVIPGERQGVTMRLVIPQGVSG